MLQSCTIFPKKNVFEKRTKLFRLVNFGKFSPGSAFLQILLFRYISSTFDNRFYCVITVQLDQPHYTILNEQFQFSEPHRLNHMNSCAGNRAS